MIRAWRNLFRPHILERGLDYYEAGEVVSLEETINGYKAVVNGTEEYSVEIEVSGDNIQDMFCDCPYADDGNYCKHMAAVLYAIEDGTGDNVSERSVCEHIRDSRQELCDVVNSIPEEQLRELLINLAENDAALCNRIMTQYAETLDEKQMVHLKMEVDRIAYENSDRSGFVDWYHASDYVDGMNAFLDENIQTLIDKELYMPAFELTNYVFQCIANQDMDDSDGGSSFVASNCYEYWQQILNECSKEEQKQMFEWFKTHQKGYVIDFMEEYISDFLMDEFHDAELLRQKLAYLDELIQKAGADTDSGSYYSVHYGRVRNILQRIRVMEQLGYTDEKIQEYRGQFRQFSDIRKLEIQEYLDKKDYNNAIIVLKESKEMDSQYAGLVSEYSCQLIDIYEKIGNKDECRRELEYQIFNCSQHNLEYVNRLKALCDEEEWKVYRERILESDKLYSIRYTFLEAEGMYDRLFDEVVSAGYLLMLDRYEKVLKKIYPEKLRDAYVLLVDKEASRVSDRKRYKELVKYLKKIAKYPGGKECVKEVAADWRAMYYRRSAMMDELKKAGF